MQDVSVCDSVKTEEVDAAELPVATIALRLLPAMLQIDAARTDGGKAYFDICLDAIDVAKSFREACMSVAAEREREVK